MKEQGIREIKMLIVVSIDTLKLTTIRRISTCGYKAISECELLRCYNRALDRKSEEKEMRADLLDYI